MKTRKPPAPPTTPRRLNSVIPALGRVAIITVPAEKAAGFLNRNRVPVLFVLFLLLADFAVGQLAAVWQRHSPDDYAAKVAGCARKPRDLVFVGGSPVAEAIDPARIAGSQWGTNPLNSVYAMGLSGGTTSDFYHAVIHGCPTPPRVLVYGITASDLNDSRHEPHGPYSLMTWGDLVEWVRLRPEAAEWVTRHFLYARIGQASDLYRYRHGIRMWAATVAEEQWPGSCPETFREADELRERADALRTGSGYAPARGFAVGRYDEVKAAGLPPLAFPYLAKYRTGSHLKYLHRLIDWCAAGGTELVLIDMPVTADLETRHRAEFTEYRQRLAGLEHERGVKVVHATRAAVGLTDAHFADLIHMNRDGAQAFSGWLAGTLDQMGRTGQPPATVPEKEEPPLATTTPAAPAPASTPRKAAAPAQVMIFASKAFFVFLPIVLILYHTLQGRTHKYRVLLAASWLFYAWLSPQYLWVIVLCTVIDYCAALKIEASGNDRIRKRWLIVSILANLGLLFAFKYTAFAWDNVMSLAQLCGVSVRDRTWDILLPLGISFHTFQGISYTVDVYRRQIRAVRSFRDYALFVSFFPQLAAGPIVRAVEFLPQMVTPPRVTARQVAEGLHFFLLGLFKKLFLADQLDQLFVAPVFGDPAAFGPAAHRWACLAWAAQIYCDFSGYSDMAVGCAKWFGFELPRNFNFPYLATSITDFWRRWHLSLSTWLRDYLYFPLGGSKGTAARTYFNLLVVFVACGLWHGATWAWLVYGLYNGALMSLHRLWDRTLTGNATADTIRGTWAWKLTAWAATLWLVVVGLILIRMPSWEAGGILFRSLAGYDFWSGAGEMIPVWVPAILMLVAVGHLFSGLRGKVCGLLELPALVRAGAYAGVVVMLVTLTPGIGKTFIYIAF